MQIKLNDNALHLAKAEMLYWKKRALAAEENLQERIVNGSPEPPKLNVAQARIAELEEVLEWYAEQTRLCRLVHSGGDAGRNALSADGGQRARKALTAGSPEPPAR